MKSIKYIVAAMTLSTLSFGSFASNGQLESQKIGTVSVSGAPTLDSLEAQIAAKAYAAGAKSFRIISATGQNKLYGIAVLYN